MTRDELLAKLRELHDTEDPEVAHSEADHALLDYIADDEVTKAFMDVPRFYA